MFKHNSQLVLSLVEYCTDKLEQINEYDSFADDFATLYQQHHKFLEKITPLLNNTVSQDDQPRTNRDSQNSKVLDAQGNELTGAALEANKVINAILEQYQKKTAKKNKSNKKVSEAQYNLTNAQSIYGDFYHFVRSFTKMDAQELFEEVLNPETTEHDALVENLTVMSQIQSIALNRQILHVSKQTNNYCDLNCLLNTCDVLGNMPTWSLVFDLSQCQECTPIEGLIISRLTYLKDGKMNAPFNSAHHDDDIFLEELGLSLNINGQWFIVGLAATLDNDRTISDLVRELGYFSADQLEQEEVPPLSEREQLDEPNWDEAEQIIDPKFNDDDFVKALYHAFKYVTYAVTHLELITDEHGNHVNLNNEASPKLPNKSEDLITALTERLNKEQDPFKHYFI